MSAAVAYFLHISQLSERFSVVTHIAIYRWKNGTSDHDIEQALADVRLLKEKVDGLLDIRCGKNFSRWNEGYTHAIVVMGRDQASLDAYRSHPDHEAVAKRIEAMEEAGIGIDFED
jgi:hypothetical protein